MPSTAESIDSVVLSGCEAGNPGKPIATCRWSESPSTYLYPASGTGGADLSFLLPPDLGSRTSSAHATVASRSTSPAAYTARLGMRYFSS